MTLVNDKKLLKTTRRNRNSKLRRNNYEWDTIIINFPANVSERNYCNDI